VVLSWRAIAGCATALSEAQLSKSRPVDRQFLRRLELACDCSGAARPFPGRQLAEVTRRLRPASFCVVLDRRLRLNSAIRWFSSAARRSRSPGCERSGVCAQPLDIAIQVAALRDPRRRDPAFFQQPVRHSLRGVLIADSGPRRWAAPVPSSPSNTPSLIASESSARQRDSKRPCSILRLRLNGGDHPRWSRSQVQKQFAGRTE